ncbi:DUF805 domain-containing protein [Lysinibacter cavernae]|uniref:Uncharacterized membrane protein YhaH (DUF805 family) n=1 Tax=Lysinibacter cavernae TaxID=1640652 RepID=A0A7X5R364_9MICO|nr:DUF805 domain-containing protein [Lysinibacter cavernae]NIH54828.1 uncharacterized membrane protein YhaH (DUF805 family) [Lysinibacter cavernae]
MTYPSAPQFNPEFSAAPVGAATPGDLRLPLYGATFGQAVSRFFKKYATFTGRSSRSEYWWVALFSFLVYLIPTILMTAGIVVGAVYAADNPVRTLMGYDSGTGEEVYVETGSGIINYAPAATMIFVGLGLMAVIGLAMLVPYYAMLWRRLHDANLPGALGLLTLLPSLGSIATIIFAVLPPKPEGQRFDV